MGKSFLLGDYSCFLKLSLEIPRGANSVKSPGESMRRSCREVSSSSISQIRSKILVHLSQSIRYRFSIVSCFVLLDSASRCVLQTCDSPPPSRTSVVVNKSRVTLYARGRYALTAFQPLVNAHRSRIPMKQWRLRDEIWNLKASKEFTCPSFPIRTGGRTKISSRGLRNFLHSYLFELKIRQGFLATSSKFPSLLYHRIEADPPSKNPLWNSSKLNSVRLVFVLQRPLSKIYFANEPLFPRLQPWALTESARFSKKTQVSATIFHSRFPRFIHTSTLERRGECV